MMKSKHIFLKLFFILLAFNLFSCRGAVKTDASTATGTPTPLSPTVPTVGDNTLGFRIWAESTPTTSYITHMGDGSVLDNFNNKCEVNTTDSVKNITCLIEGEEQDLQFGGVKINYNVPSSFCSYFQAELPYMYNYPVGAEPTTAINNEAGTVIHGGVAAGTTSETCPYDYTSTSGPNCCEGKYDLTIWNSTSSGDVSTVQTKKDWGGKKSNCLYGPAVDAFPMTKNGPKVGIVYVEGSGINFNFKVASPLSKDKNSNIYISNYYNPADHGGLAPVPYRVIAAAPFQMQKNYVFTCLDRASDVIASITLQIRDWNTHREFLKLNAGDPDEDVVGTVDDNDYNDLKDITLQPLNYPSGYPKE